MTSDPRSTDCYQHSRGSPGFKSRNRGWLRHRHRRRRSGAYAKDSALWKARSSSILCTIAPLKSLPKFCFRKQSGPSQLSRRKLFRQVRSNRTCPAYVVRKTKITLNFLFSVSVISASAVDAVGDGRWKPGESSLSLITFLAAYDT